MKCIGLCSSRVVYISKDQRTVGKDCFLNWAFVMDVSAKVAIINSVPVLGDFSDEFHMARHVAGRGC